MNNTKKTIAIIGGDNKRTIEKLAKREGVNVLHHDGHVKGGGNRTLYKKYVRKADVVIILQGACCHESMYAMKDLCNVYSKPIDYQEGRGITGAFSKAVTLLSA
ncbi:DUF2325 domain-containing protein [Pontibacillus halophilus]|uniref:DUF2325 domain-containing protein n=1 Tax=Pontibacillus halophilus TaxID=516704 RepID=UPI0004057510|nr:DUF2325 domain-containing protein [Pontibacillus halophilus]